MPAHSSGPASARIDGFRDPEDEVLVHDHELRVATLRDRAVPVLRSVDLRVPSLAELFEPLRALGTAPARVHHRAHADASARPELPDAGPDRHDLPGELMAGDQGVGHLSPIAADGVNVGVTDAAIVDFHGDVLRSQGSSLKLHELVWTVGGVGGHPFGREGARRLPS